MWLIGTEMTVTRSYCCKGLVSEIFGLKIYRLSAFGGDKYCTGDYGVNMACNYKVKSSSSLDLLSV